MRRSPPLLNSSVKMIIFDHDDTLVGTIQPKWAQHKYIAKEFYSRTVTDEELHTHWGKPFTVLLRHLYKTDHIDMAMSYNIATRELFPKNLLKGTIDTLKTLKKAGKKLAIVTATTKSSLMNDFKTLGIDQNLFDYVQTEDDTIFHKPDPRVLDPVKDWIKDKGIDFSEVLCVGDHFHDMQTAQDAGFKFIGVGTGLISPEQFKKHGIPVIRALPELLKVLK